MNGYITMMQTMCSCCTSIREWLCHPMSVLMAMCLGAYILGLEYGPPPPPHLDPARFDSMVDALSCADSKSLLLRALQGELDGAGAIEDAAIDTLGEDEVKKLLGTDKLKKNEKSMGVALTAAAVSAGGGR